MSGNRRNQKNLLAYIILENTETEKKQKEELGSEDGERLRRTRLHKQKTDHDLGISKLALRLGMTDDQILRNVVSLTRSSRYPGIIAGASGRDR